MLAVGRGLAVLKAPAVSPGRPGPRRLPDGEDRPARLRRHADGAGRHTSSSRSAATSSPAAPIELHTADTGGNPAQARTKTQELVERLKVSVLIGPLAAFEALAIDDYIRSSQTPILTVAGAEDMTQRKANPWLVRPSSTSAQPSHPLGDYAAKDLKFKRVARSRRRLRLRPRKRRGLPARVRGQRRQGGAEAVHAAERARLRHLHFAAQAEPRRRVSPAMPARTRSSSASSSANTATRRKFSAASRQFDESLLQQMGDDVLGAITGNWYSARARQPDQQAVRRGDPARLQGRPGRLCRGNLSLRRGARACGQGRSAARSRTRTRFMKALQDAKVPDTLRGPVSFDELRQCRRQHLHPQGREEGRQVVNTVVKTYPNVSQFWTYNAGRVPEEPGLFARLSAGEEPGELRAAMSLVSRTRQQR